MTLVESIDTLRRLIAKADEYTRRYTVELQAHERVQAGLPILSHEDAYDTFTPQEMVWYVDAYREAKAKAASGEAQP